MATIPQTCTFLQQCPPPTTTSLLFPQFSPSSSTCAPLSRVSPKFSVITCCQASPVAAVVGNTDLRASERSVIRLGLPTNERLKDDTLALLKDIQLPVKISSERQFRAPIPQLSNTEAWFQRPKDTLRKLLSGDFDLGFMGFDDFCEYGQGNEDLILVHDALEFGECHLSVAVPNYGLFENINSLKELAEMPEWTSERPLKLATSFTYLGPKFVEDKRLKHVTFEFKAGGVEAAPAMGTADAIIDLVGSGTTLRENNLKEIEGGIVLQSQVVLVASKKSLITRNGALDTTKELLERLEAHLRASAQFTLTANMRGKSAEEVAERMLSQPSLSGLQGPTISPVFGEKDGKVLANYFAIVVCAQKKDLYKAVQQLRAIGGSGVLVSPVTYIFDEETPRWRQLLTKLGL